MSKLTLALLVLCACVAVSMAYPQVTSPISSIASAVPTSSSLTSALPTSSSLPTLSSLTGLLSQLEPSQANQFIKIFTDLLSTVQQGTQGATGGSGTTGGAAATDGAGTTTNGATGATTA
ncbi:hypothetical protein JYU34_007627 [Plutella xylostella]|uniref:Uncharacterized protein n=1 Tax=Plutella xylostella TaxID=51655 RepID=A0ABQ7QQW4_PLUXY|nr:hypothetical protein JYU34_007627 [Plutella xylostella]